MCVVIPSAAEPLAALSLWHYVFRYRVDRIYMVQGSLELSFFRVIVIIRFRLTRNVLYNIAGYSETICVTAVICSGKVVVFLSYVIGIFCCWICSNSTRI
ncbi:hypothetical protein M9H77_27867 [Catharanthus roseus]|uniref:Uncharacterized protein n=1 Tax=Catharanthus roseus TaxID=4058 RepID=A0ACC0AEL5_CATRO|nr:hypothetical protein M9H77_27867 [Catharanthus roseus]